jgi:hypothetical protein
MPVLKGLKEANIEWLEEVYTMWWQLKRDNLVGPAII